MSRSALQPHQVLAARQQDDRTAGLLLRNFRRR